MSDIERERRVAAIQAAMEKGAAAGAAYRARLDTHRAALDPAAVFTPQNIGHWLRLCLDAGVPMVPLDTIATVPVVDVRHFDTNMTPALTALVAAADGYMAERTHHMLRWSCCTGDFMKWWMGSGKHSWNPEMQRVVLDDERIYDLIWSYPEADVTLYARPWIKAKIIDDFPVEYRAYVWANSIEGISNYYPQRPLPNDANTLKHIALVYAYVAKLIVTQQLPCNHGIDVPESVDIKKNSWTADFIVADDGRVMLLDGGPPFGGGADPCCFHPKDVGGIALSDHSGRFPLLDEMAAGIIHEPGTGGLDV